MRGMTTPSLGKRRTKNHKTDGAGVPVVAQWLTNPTLNHDFAGLIPGLTQWIKDLVLP